MHLPGRLRSTTLGDLLGVLHRAGATGTLELVEDRGRVHRVYVTSGLVVAVENDGAAAPSLGEILRRDRAADDDVLRRSFLRAIASRRLHGEVLVQEFRISPEVVGHALRRQLLDRLATLEALVDARIGFHVAVRLPRGAFRDSPLNPREFLYGRRRARERSASASSPPAAPRDTRAWAILGLSPGVDASAVKRAYRQLARSFHPDLYPDATEEQRRDLNARFVEITEAYRALVA